MSKIRATIIVPFDAAGKRVQDAIARTLRESGIDIFRLDDIPPGASWMNAIKNAIESSDFLVFEVTRHNPNVYYELGYAHALRKPTILLVRDDAKKPPPSDLQGHLYVLYDPNNLRSLVERLRKAAERFVDRGRDET